MPWNVTPRLDGHGCSPALLQSSVYRRGSITNSPLPSILRSPNHVRTHSEDTDSPPPQRVLASGITPSPARNPLSLHFAVVREHRALISSYVSVSDHSVDMCE